MVSDVKTGHNVAISIKQEGTLGDNSPILGTNKQGLCKDMTKPPGLSPKARLLRGAPSITYPVDNDPQETTTLGDRTIQKWTGAEKIDGKLERWMIDTDLIGAVRGYREDVGGKNIYKRGDEFVKFEICIYHMNASSEIKETEEGEFAPDTGYSYKVTLTGVTFGNYDAPSEANARQKETVSYSAETMEITALSGSV